VGTNVEMCGLQIVNEFYTSEQLSSQLKAQGSDGLQYGNTRSCEAGVPRGIADRRRAETAKRGANRGAPGGLAQFWINGICPYPVALI